MTLIPACNSTNVPQRVGGTWIPARATVPVPLLDALALRESPDFAFDWSAGDYTPAFADDRLVGLAFMSPLSVFDGYGQVGVQTARELLARGLDLDLYNCGWLVERDLDPALLRRLRAPKRGYDLALAKGPPDETMHKLVGRTLVNHGMWESTPLPPAWVPALNKLPLAIVTSSAQVDIYRESGVTCPIEVVPDAIDTAFWSKRPEKPAEDAPFTVVSWSKMSSRKMPIEMVQVLSTAFPHAQYPDMRFEFKTSGGNFGAGLYQIPHFADPRFVVHDGAWPVDELRSWVAKAHLAFFLSRGEGMFNPPMQAMALGVPVVCADHSGPADYMEERFGYPVQLDPREPLVPSPMGAGMRWWNPDLEHAVAQVRAAYEDYAEARRRARRAKAMVLARYNPSAVTERLIKVLRSVA